MPRALSLCLAIVSYLFVSEANSQEDSSTNVLKNINTKAYLETYYGYDFGEPQDNARPEFLYNYDRHNEISLNLGLIGFHYEEDRIRGNFALMAGSYVRRNLAEEPAGFRNIYEANIGVKLSKSRNLWLDVGVMESNLGFESAVGVDCWTLSRSLLAENSPYYLSAAKLSFITKNEKWIFRGLFSNGWQKMINGHPSVGHQIQWLPNENWTLNSSSFVGRVDVSAGPNTFFTEELQRYFHNFYLQYDGEKFGFTLGTDIGFDHEVGNPENISGWLGGVLVTRYKLSKKMAVAARAEYFFDPNLSVISSPVNDAFENIGASINLDYQIFSNLRWRVEGRAFSNNNPIFRYKNEPTTSNYYLGTSLALKFGDIGW